MLGDLFSTRSSWVSQLHRLSIAELLVLHAEFVGLSLRVNPRVRVTGPCVRRRSPLSTCRLSKFSALRTFAPCNRTYGRHTLIPGGITAGAHSGLAKGALASASASGASNHSTSKMYVPPRFFSGIFSPETSFMMYPPSPLITILFPALVNAAAEANAFVESVT